MPVSFQAHTVAQCIHHALPTAATLQLCTIAIMCCHFAAILIHDDATVPAGNGQREQHGRDGKREWHGAVGNGKREQHGRDSVGDE
jgi:hypothetical protein